MRGAKRRRENDRPVTSTPVCKQPPGVIVPAVDLRRCEGKGDLPRYKSASFTLAGPHQYLDRIERIRDLNGLLPLFEREAVGDEPAREQISSSSTLAARRYCI